MTTFDDLTNTADLKFEDQDKQWVECSVNEETVPVQEQLIRAKRIIIRLADIVDSAYSQVTTLSNDISTLRDQFENKTGRFEFLNDGDDDHLLGKETSFLDVCLANGIDYDEKEDARAILMLARAKSRELLNSLRRDLNDLCGEDFELVFEKYPRERVIEFAKRELVK